MKFMHVSKVYAIYINTHNIKEVKIKTSYTHDHTSTQEYNIQGLTVDIPYLKKLVLNKSTKGGKQRYL